MSLDPPLAEGQVLCGPSFNEPMRVETVRLGELPCDRSDHILLLTATPHKGDPENFALFLHQEDRGYDITSLHPESGELRLIEMKGLAAGTGSTVLTPNERRVARNRPDCYWLYIVTGCAREPTLRDPIPDPARFLGARSAKWSATR